MNKTNRLVKKISIVDTLREMNVGDVITLNATKVSISVVRATAHRLKATGLTYKIRENKGVATVERI